MNSEFETDSSLSYNSTPNVIKLKLAIRVKPAPQEYSIRSGLPGAAPQIKPAELEVYVEAAKNIPLVNEKAPSTYVRASVHHPKYGNGLKKINSHIIIWVLRLDTSLSIQKIRILKFLVKVEPELYGRIIYLERPFFEVISARTSLIRK